MLFRSPLAILGTIGRLGALSPVSGSQRPNIESFGGQESFGTFEPGTIGSKGRFIDDFGSPVECLTDLVKASGGASVRLARSRADRAGYDSLHGGPSWPT